MERSPPQQVTRLLARIESGDAAAADDLVPLVYDDLRELARKMYFGNPAGRTLNPTALVHEAFVRLVGSDFSGRRHFLGAAVVAMRRLLTDHARAKRTDKRGGARHHVTLVDRIDDGPDRADEVDLVALDDALHKLATLHERQARVVELRFLAGLSVAETAEALEISERTAKADWQMAKAWLSRELGDA